ncbi:hypothetical protein [Flavobacterium sp. JAS]|uniref:hypothetical protein n=1 Tax=Flavobacterium sp. JAS TaxID=2897329 RepID=UPI001E6249C0|nr:hypothetical protein [Flavobacterium sp. JAS]MCD0469057.1 hypothetical protein [Flavobacterium sp. JAS]
MKSIIIAAFLLLSSLVQSQFKNYQCNKHLLYLVGDDKEIHSIFFNDKIDAPVFNMQYFKESDFSECDDVDFYYLVKNKKHDLHGRIFNQKYVMATGSTTFSRGIQIKGLLKTKDLYTIREYTCQEYKAEIDKLGSHIVIYTTNLGDGVDYNKLMKEIEKLMEVEIPKLAKGEIIVQLFMQFPDGRLWKMLDYLRSETVNQEIVIDEKNIEQIVSLSDEIAPSKNIPSPVYCSVIGHSEGTDETVKEKLNEFLGNMCTYFEQFGNLDNKDFCIYFDKEIKRKAKFYKKFEIFNTKQAAEFEKELLGYSKVNMTKNLVN